MATDTDDDDSSRARAAARREARRHARASRHSSGGGAVSVSGDGDGTGAAATAKRKMKKKKRRTTASERGDDEDDAARQRRRQARADRTAKSRSTREFEKSAQWDEADDVDGGRAAARATLEFEKSAQGDEMDRGGGGRAAAELAKSRGRGGLEEDAAAAKVRREDDDDDGNKTPAYCFEADTTAMAEINRDGLVAVDAAGGIEAFVADVVDLDGDAVGVIKSDAEIAKEEERRYSRIFCLVVAALVVVIVALAVPLTLRFAAGRRATRITLITAEPTDAPSLVPSAMPSSMPSSIRFTEIVAKLWPLSGAALRRRGSPQYLAAMWMADADPIPNMKGGTGLDITSAQFEQRYALAVFYYAMDGPNWVDNRGWLGSSSECDWSGIHGASPGCPEGCIPRSDFLGDYDRVCRLAMGRESNLYGEIPSELAVLEDIRWFEVQTAFLVGTIPAALGAAWTKLHTLLLGSNYLGGDFPETFADNQMLGTIFLDHNNFNGTFPNSVATMKNLEWLDVEGNAFWGTLPEGIGDLKSLRILNVNNNSLTGYLPDSWDGDNLIEDLEVAYNNFKGRLPFSLAQATFLKDLRATGNRLTGSIPLEYYQFEYLEELYLDGNLLGGELPQTAEPFYDGLQELSLHSNAFEGRFPVEHFKDALRLKVLALHGNDLTGSIPPHICERKDASRAYTRLEVLTVDCDKMECSCCTCYMSEEMIQDVGS